MITLCPHCATRFRITSEQLAARQGLVRCGQCQGVFNGFEHLNRGGTTDAGPSQNMLTGSETPNAPSLADTPLHADNLTGRIEAAAPVPNWAPAADTIIEPQSAPAAADNKRLLALHLLRGYVHADPPAPVWTPLIDEITEPTQAAAPDSPTAPEAPSEEALEAFARSLASTEVTAPNVTVESSDATDPHLESLADPLITPPRPLADVLRADPMHRPELVQWPRPKRGGPVAALALLGTALTCQAAFVFRTEIAATWPEAKPALAQAGALLGFSIPLPRQIDALSIEASELQADPVRPNVVQVTAILRNRANTVQAYPTLEITFTDTLERPVARRSLDAAEYLAQKPGKEDGIAASGEAIAKAAIETAGLKPSGYRLRLYY